MKVKDEFIYLITHEFKTPITVINSGHIKVNNHCVDIVYVLRAIVNSVQVHGKQKNINLNFATDLIEKEIYIDEEKVERIVLNLLANALKFTSSGKNITVLLSVKEHKNQDYISIIVKDEGIGIPVDKHKIIFNSFGQADTSLSRQAEGTGLGLYLVKLLLNVLQGEISLVSTIGKGSTFTVLLPAVKPSSAYKKNGCSINNQLISGDERIVQVVSIEFSDIYFD